MTSKTRSFRISPALVVSCVALFLALAGTAFAAVGKNTVRSAHIVDGTVRTIDLRDNAVNSAKVADESLTAADLGANSVNSDEIAENAVGTSEVAPDSLTAGDLGAASVTSSEVADQSLTANDLGPDSVGASEIAADSVGASELQTDSVRAAELAPLVQVSNSTEIKGGDNATVSVACPAGTVVISGGGSAGFYQVHLTSTYRSANGWRIDARSGAVGDTTITAYAYCLAA
ncbi:MAG TPA: hypothetical protein VGO66_05420 [Solirubrobacterales bacterium]|jgi:hypothetical protein|nr:hypothetical protein [Solirubrobacterales bacterium]